MVPHLVLRHSRHDITTGIAGGFKASMKPDGLAEPSQAREVLIDKKWSVVIIERTLSTDESPDLADPGWMVD